MIQNTEYPKNVWCIDNNNPNMAIKIVNDEKIINVPLTTEILEEIKRQLEAKKIFTAFQKVNNNDENILGYLNLILNDYVNYLDSSDLNSLINKMHEIELTNQLDQSNILNFKALETSLTSNDIDSFYDSLDNFNIYNNIYFEETRTRKSH